MARQLGPSAINLDIMMPELDGWSVLRLLKDDAALADIPVVLCTIVNDRHRGFALGAADYLLKPVSRDQLRSTLSRYCGDPPCKLLIVEDDVPTRGLYSRAAQNFGWHVVEAGTGREALTALEQSIPDLILLDLMMPDIDGFELVEALQATLAWRNIPVVIVTARDLTSDDIKRLNGHVERIIAKADRDVDGFARYISAKLAEFCPTEK
jgi:CheY-like chemotaxis protein